MNRASQSLEHSRGFTLVELMVTIAILAILLGIALPDFRQMLASERVRSANSDLFSALLVARSEAIKRNGTVTLVPASTISWAGGWTVQAGGSPLQTQNALNTSVAVVQQDSSNTTVSPTTVSFGGNGRPSPASADITFIFSSSAVPAVPARCTSLTLAGLPETKRDTDGNPANGCQ
ncbi:MAG TPA: GspH/FimT family pseudopilin [Rhodocyclaceae bacterium]|nr:GspH/FimT family pseudopilin [Rhodocyclaceae bacterium]